MQAAICQTDKNANGVENTNICTAIYALQYARQQYIYFPLPEEGMYKEISSCASGDAENMEVVYRVPKKNIDAGGSLFLVITQNLGQLSATL